MDFPIPSPDATIEIVQVGDRAADKAIDLEFSGTIAVPGCSEPLTLPELLTHYVLSRNEALRDAIPVREGKRLKRYEVKPLTEGQWMQALRVQDLASQALTVFYMACHRFTDAEGVAHTAPLVGGSIDAPQAEKWSSLVRRQGGAMVFREIAAVALMRAEVPADALSPFALPRGSRLPL